MTGDVHNRDESELPDNLASPARRALLAHGYTRLEQLTGISEAEIARWHGIGPKALSQLRAALTTRGLAFASGQPDEVTGR